MGSPTDRAGGFRVPEKPRARPTSGLARVRRPKPIRDRPRILLLNPPRYRGINVVRMYRAEYLFVDDNPLPPIDLAYFAAAARGHADVMLLDAHGEALEDEAAYRRIEEFAPDVLLVRGVLDILEHDLALAKRYKRARPETLVVLNCRGALDAEQSVFQEMPFLDGFARGEIDAFAEPLSSFASLADIVGMSVPGAPDTTIRVVPDLDAHPFPDLDALPPLWGSGYRLPYYGVDSGYLLVASRGCPYACTYCMVGGIDGRPFRYRRRDPENVVEELAMIRARFGIRDLYVWDEIFTNPHGQRVSERIAERGIDVRWLCEGKPDLVRAPMLATMKRAGCGAIYYGIESGDDAILTDIEKGHTRRDAARAIALTKAASITSAAYVMVGFPNETWASYLRTLEFLFETQPDLVRYCFLVPYPSTVLHRDMAERGLLVFDRPNLDRRISQHRTTTVSLRSHRLSPASLWVMDFAFKQIFADELARVPRARLG